MIAVLRRELGGDGLHWYGHLPTASKFFMTHVMRVLLHFVMTAA